MVLYLAIDDFEAKNALVRSRDSWESALHGNGDLLAAGSHYGAALSDSFAPAQVSSVTRLLTTAVKVSLGGFKVPET